MHMLRNEYNLFNFNSIMNNYYFFSINYNGKDNLKKIYIYKSGVDNHFMSRAKK